MLDSENLKQGNYVQSISANFYFPFVIKLTSVHMETFIEK
jgi:hypothetical protein